MAQRYQVNTFQMVNGTYEVSYWDLFSNLGINHAYPITFNPGNGAVWPPYPGQYLDEIPALAGSQVTSRADAVTVDRTINASGAVTLSVSNVPGGKYSDVFTYGPNSTTNPTTIEFGEFTPASNLDAFAVKKFGVFNTWATRPTGLTSADANKNYVFSKTGNIHQWTGTAWKVFNSAPLNVLDHGIIGDGLVDESAAFVALLALNLTTRYYFPRGIYRFATEQQLNIYTDAAHHDAPQITGDGIDATIFKSEVVGGSLFKYSQKSNQYFYFGRGLLFQDFTILGGTAINSNGISVSGATYPYFRRVKIKSVTGHAFSFPFDTAATVQGTAPNDFINADSFSNIVGVFTECLAENCGKWGFWIDTSNSPVTMVNCYASSCKGGGLYLQSGTSSITNCSFSYCGDYYDLKSGGIWLGDDYPNAKSPPLVARSYVTVYSCKLENIELDSNYNRNAFLSGYQHTFANLRLIQGSLASISPTYFNSYVFVQMGSGNYPLYDSVFRGVVVRVPSGTTLLGLLFSDNLGYANNSSTGGSYAANVQIENLFDFYPAASLTKYTFSNANSRYITATEKGRLAYSYPSSIPTAGTWAVGDKLQNTTPVAGGYSGWVCTTAGTPGTWKGFGLIQA
jgi:Pectate lyase superfamily protein